MIFGLNLVCEIVEYELIVMVVVSEDDELCVCV